MQARTPRTPFDWLADPTFRRSSLRDIETAVRRGRFQGPGMAERRAALMAALEALSRDPTLRPRESIRLLRLIVAMGESDLARHAREARSGGRP